MITGWRGYLCFFLVFYLYSTTAHPTEETFDEQLTLRPLQDGKLAARFSFKTLLKGAQPRNPKHLNNSDTRMFTN